MTVLKISLMAFSFIFWAAGLAMLTVGIWAKISLEEHLPIFHHNKYPDLRPSTEPIILQQLSNHSTHPASVWRCCAAMGLSRMHQCCCREEISSAHLRSLPVGSAVSWTYCWALWSILSQSYISDIAELFKVDYGMLCYLTQKMRRKQMPWMQYKGACTIMVYIATMTGLSHHGPWSNRKLILDTIMVLYPAAAARPARDAATV
ncbi:unnamed protein product [Ranitomeya imitator]|uniref:Uncharacterized protein n=1 Tax=Ranitomeya imitator TaxID=111125 RepID=A0ABN9L0W3_9NEOB|nr:unnamed protein product [Ranitomeya imitator]